MSFFTSDCSQHKPLGVACAVGLVGCCIAVTAFSVSVVEPAAVLAVASYTYIVIDVYSTLCPKKGDNSSLRIFTGDVTPGEGQKKTMQARAHRIGTKHEVVVIRFITAHSVETEILARCDEKLEKESIVIKACPPILSERHHRYRVMA